MKVALFVRNLFLVAGCCQVVACGTSSDGNSGGDGDLTTTAKELPNPSDLKVVKVVVSAATSEDAAKSDCENGDDESGVVFFPQSGDPLLCLGGLEDTAFFKSKALTTSSITSDAGGTYYVGLVASDVFDRGYFLVILRQGETSYGSNCEGISGDAFANNGVTTTLADLVNGDGLCGFDSQSDAAGAYLRKGADLTGVRVVLPGAETGFDMTLTKIGERE